MDFNCPNCNQPISLTPELAGQKVSCPHCSQHIQLPPAQTNSPYATPGTAAPVAPGAAPTTTRTSGLAVTCLVLAIAGFLIPIICHLLAIVFGHISRSQIKKDPSLSGGGIALAGLIISYIFVAIFGVAIIAAIALPVFSSVTSRAQGTKELSDMRQVMMAAKMYAIDNDGKFPDSLEQLTPNYISDPNILFTVTSSGREQFTYIPGSTEVSPAETIVLVSPVVRRNRRAVATADGAAMLLDEIEYQQRTSGQP
jgi:Tfp pilus assembly major pilin PilA